MFDCSGWIWLIGLILSLLVWGWCWYVSVRAPVNYKGQGLRYKFISFVMFLTALFYVIFFLFLYLNQRVGEQTIFIRTFVLLGGAGVFIVTGWLGFRIADGKNVCEENRSIRSRALGEKRN